MGALAVGGGKLARRNEAAAQEALFVFAVEQDDFHGLILVLTEQHSDFRITGAFFHGKSLPVDAVFFQGIQRFIEAGKQGFFELVELKKGGMVRAAEGLPLAFDDGEDFLAEGEVLAEVGGDFLGNDYGVPTAAPGRLLVALRS